MSIFFLRNPNFTLDQCCPENRPNLALQRRLPLRHSGESLNPVRTIRIMAILVHGHRSTSGCRIKSGM